MCVLLQRHGCSSCWREAGSFILGVSLQLDRYGSAVVLQLGFEALSFDTCSEAHHLHSVISGAL